MICQYLYLLNKLKYIHIPSVCGGNLCLSEFNTSKSPYGHKSLFSKKIEFTIAKRNNVKIENKATKTLRDYVCYVQYSNFSYIRYYIYIYSMEWIERKILFQKFGAPRLYYCWIIRFIWHPGRQIGWSENY